MKNSWTSNCYSWKSRVLMVVLSAFFSGFPHHTQNEIPYFFLTLWPIFPTNFAYLQRIFQNIGYKRLQFSNNLVLSVVKYHIYCFNELSFSTPLKPWNSLPFPDLWPISQPFLTLSANSLLFKALKKWNLIPDFFKIFLPVGTLSIQAVVYSMYWWIN